MKAAIATVVKIEGKATATDLIGNKRELSMGDALFLDDLAVTTQGSSVVLDIQNAKPLKLESLQSFKLTSDISPEYMPEITDAVLNVNLPEGTVEQLFSAYPFGESPILTEIEPVYDIGRLKQTDKQLSAPLELGDILQSARTSECLDQYLRFNENSESTVVYFSQQGNFSDASSIESSADKVLSISSTGYENSAELLSFLIDNFFIDDHS